MTLLASFFYSAHLPERLAPGRFDYIGECAGTPLPIGSLPPGCPCVWLQRGSRGVERRNSLGASLGAGRGSDTVRSQGQHVRSPQWPGRRGGRRAGASRILRHSYGLGGLGSPSLLPRPGNPRIKRTLRVALERNKTERVTVAEANRRESVRLIQAAAVGLGVLVE